MTDAPAAADPKPKTGRRRALLALSAVVLLGGVGWAVYDFIVMRDIISTDDAYVGGDIVQITTEQSGTVIQLYADDTQSVRQGQPLIELDPADAKVAMASAEAGLAEAVRRVRALLAQADQLRAQIDARQADVDRARRDAERRGALVATGAISKEDFAHARDSSASQIAALTAARAQLDETLAEIGDTSIAANPEVLTAAARLRDAALGLSRTKIVAPIDGIVAKRVVEVGQHVASGAAVMAVVPLENTWIDANFKEVQLQDMRVGQPVTLTTDIYGGGVDYHGKIAGFAAGSGNAFALLPAQNATGNWIKIVQRIPVRILLDPSEIKARPLRIGFSTTVDVDVRDKSGPLFASQVRNHPFPTKQSDGDDPAVGALIAKIIADNAGPAEMAAAGAR